MSKSKPKNVKSSYSKKKLRLPRKTKDLPATLGALENVRSELKSNITGVRLEVKSLEKKMDAKFSQMDAKFEEMKSVNYRMLALLEEQNQ